MAQQQKPSRGLYYLIILLLSCAMASVAIYHYRTSLIIAGFNQWGTAHQVKIIGLEQLEFNNGVLSVGSLVIAHQKTKLQLTNTTVKLSNWQRVKQVKIASAKLVIDYHSVIALKATQPQSTNNPPDWSALPQLLLGETELELTNFPATLVPEFAQQLTINQLDFAGGNTPTIYVKATLGQKRDLAASFQLSASYHNSYWQGAVDLAMAEHLELIKSMLPTRLQQLQLDGQLKVEFKVAASKPYRLDLALKLKQLTIANDQEILIKSITLAANTALQLTPAITLAPITFELSPVQINITAARCIQWIKLIAAKASGCELLQQFGFVLISSTQPIKGQVTVAIDSLPQWQLSVSDSQLELVTAQDIATLSLSQFNLTKQQVLSDWQLNGTTQRLAIAKTTEFSLAGKIDKNQDIVLDIDRVKIAITALAQSDSTVNKLQISNQQPMTLVLADGQLNTFDSTWSTDTTGLAWHDIAINQIAAEHQVNYTDHRVKVNSQWLADGIELTSSDTVSYNQGQVSKIAGQWLLPSQAHTKLLPMNKQWRELIPEPLHIELQLTNTLNYQATFNNNKLTIVSASLKGQIQADSASYNDTVISQLQADWRCQLKFIRTLVTNCQVATMIDELNIGIAVSQLQSQLTVDLNGQNLILKIKAGGGKLLGGEFYVEPSTISDLNDSKLTIKLTNISLAQIVALQQQEGIKVSGFLSGTLPISYHDQAFSVTDGAIENQPPGGHIEVKNNQTIDQLRLSQPQLIFVLDALEDLTYTKLTSSINYQADGWADLKVSIHGKNPDIERPIEFNYSHQENILQLMRSLQIGDQISKQLEKIVD